MHAWPLLLFIHLYAGSHRMRKPDGPVGRNAGTPERSETHSISGHRRMGEGSVPMIGSWGSAGRNGSGGPLGAVRRPCPQIARPVRPIAQVRILEQSVPRSAGISVDVLLLNATQRSCPFEPQPDVQHNSALDMGWIRHFAGRSPAVTSQPERQYHVEDAKSVVQHIEHAPSRLDRSASLVKTPTYTASAEDVRAARSPLRLAPSGTLPLLDAADIAKHDNVVDGFCK